MQKFTSYFGCEYGCVFRAVWCSFSSIQERPHHLFLSAVYCPLKCAWNSPCKVAMCSRAVFHFTFYIQRWLCKQVTWTIKFPRHKLDQIALLLRLWYATFCICCQCSAKLMYAANVGFTSCPESVLMTLVWALLMCCNYWDQCRHDSRASASMFTLSCGLIPPPVNSSLSAREETWRLAWCLYGNMWRVRTLSGL